MDYERLRKIADDLVCLFVSAVVTLTVVIIAATLKWHQEPRERLEVADVPLLTEEQKLDALRVNSVAFEAGGKTYVISEGAREALADYV